MGEESSQTMTMKKKKKKGRPSLIELQKRSLRQQQLQQQQDEEEQNPPQQLNPNLLKNPNSLNSASIRNPRSTRRNPNLPPEDDSTEGEDEEEEADDERKQKKHKLLLGLNSSRKRDENEGNSDGGREYKRQKISDGSDQMEEKLLKVTVTLHGSPVESGPTTTQLPDKKLLVFILDRLQKKDTYGVFSDPVDPEELPDYHEIVRNPMDFGTLRRKLGEGAFVNLEQFEKDVFLICTNAMEYNSQDTIYFRQARSMLEMAKKDFENLRQDSDDCETPPPQPKVAKRGRPPGKGIKKTLELPSDCAGSEPASATVATGVDSGTNGYNLRKATVSQKFRPDPFARASYGSQNGEAYTGWSYDCESEFPASVVRAVTKYGMKHFPVDENKRDTYTNSLVPEHVPSVLTTFDGEPKQLLPVGLSSEHGYAKSLARFAAGLGPTAWKIASRKIQSVLPPGVEFGPGWVGEKLAEHVTFSSNQNYSNSMSNDYSSKLMSPPTSSSNTAVSNRCSLQTREDLVETNKREVMNAQCESSSLSASYPAAPTQLQPNGFNVGFGFNNHSQMGMARLASPPGTSSFNYTVPNSQVFGMVPSSSNASQCSTPANLENPSRLYSENIPASGSGPVLHKTYWHVPPNKQDSEVFPPDLNVGLLLPVSPASSNVQIGSPQQPDLALQL